MVHNYEVNRDWCFSAYQNRLLYIPRKMRGLSLSQKSNEKGLSPKSLLAIANKQLSSRTDCNFLCVSFLNFKFCSPFYIPFLFSYRKFLTGNKG